MIRWWFSFLLIIITSLDENKSQVVTVQKTAKTHHYLLIEIAQNCYVWKSMPRPLHRPVACPINNTQANWQLKRLQSLMSSATPTFHKLTTAVRSSRFTEP